MKQLIQNYKTGKLDLSEAPVPISRPGYILVRNVNSLISVGTEKSIIKLGRQSLIGKARSRPEQFKRAIEKVKTEGFFEVWKQAMARLDDPKPLGYSSAGIVMETGQEVTDFKQGDKVACIGADVASHAEIISLPKDFCVKIPEGVDFEEAAFGMVAIIALQGVKCAEVVPGQKVAVLGLGLIGQITVQILKAYGCDVIGTDLQQNKLDLAKTLGCDQVAMVDDMPRAVVNFTDGKGVDKIIITAASKDNSSIILSADIAKFGAKIILVGVVDIQIPQQIFWEKELLFQVSKAGGYDSVNDKQYDYPEDYKKMSQDVNLKEFLDLVKKGSVQLKPLITHRYNINNALEPYRMITGKNSGQEYLGILLEYNNDLKKTSKVDLQPAAAAKKNDIGLSVIGAGIFGKSMILPCVKKFGNVRTVGIATTKPQTSKHTAKKFGFEYCTTDHKQVINDNNTNTVIILTRHDSHAVLIKESLEANKNVFVEKPIATSMDDLKMLYRLIMNKPCHLMVGYNRRYSPFAAEIKKRISDKHFPLIVNIQVNPGNIPRGHWVFDEKQGGGRIIGEVCHFVDLAQFFIDAKPKSVFTQNIDKDNNAINLFDNTASIIKFEDGSICNIVYTSIGNRSYTREEIRVFDNDAVYSIDDFRTLRIHTPKKRKTIKLSKQNLGHKNEFSCFFNEIENNSGRLDKLKEGYLLTTLTTLKMIESLKTGNHVEIKIKELEN